MPVTPFHFGVGLLMKGTAPTRASLLAFAASQVVIDLESGYYLLRGEWPVHRALHTFALATPVGLGAGLLVWCVGLAVPSLTRRFTVELGFAPCLLGGLIGGLTHPLLDGVMHSDIRPLMPFSAANPLYQLVGLGTLHLACVLAALLGAILWVARGGSSLLERSR